MNPKEFAFDEYRDHVLYKTLANEEKDLNNKDMLLKLAQHEYEHFLFWKNMLPGYEPVLTAWELRKFKLMRKFLGLTFTIKFLERHEEGVIQAYKNYVGNLRGEQAEQLHRIIHEEKEHEKYFVSQIKEGVIKYIGFIALGLADAIVEITGVHAGFLGVTGSTLVAGISGLIVGFAAAISMGSAAYLQAKQDPDRSPIVSAFTTGISYIVSVIGLAIPYFITQSMASAFIWSIVVGIILIAALTSYSAVVFERKFLREFLETTILMLATAGATYLLGVFLGRVFGIESITAG